MFAYIQGNNVDTWLPAQFWQVRLINVGKTTGVVRSGKNLLLTENIRGRFPSLDFPQFFQKNNSPDYSKLENLIERFNSVLESGFFRLYQVRSTTLASAAHHDGTDEAGAAPADLHDEVASAARVDIYDKTNSEAVDACLQKTTDTNSDRTSYKYFAPHRDIDMVAIKIIDIVPNKPILCKTSLSKEETDVFPVALEIVNLLGRCVNHNNIKTKFENLTKKILSQPYESQLLHEVKTLFIMANQTWESSFKSGVFVNLKTGTTRRYVLTDSHPEKMDVSFGHQGPTRATPEALTILRKLA